MAHPVSIPDDLYAQVAELAAQRGETPEEVIQAATEAWVQAQHTASKKEVVPGYDPSMDPLAPFAGAFELISPDSLDRHDLYIGQEAMDPHALSCARFH